VPLNCGLVGHELVVIWQDVVDVVVGGDVELVVVWPIVTDWATCPPEIKEAVTLPLAGVLHQEAMLGGRDMQTA
jgi:hypothetical protein